MGQLVCGLLRATIIEKIGVISILKFLLNGLWMKVTAIHVNKHAE